MSLEGDVHTSADGGRSPRGSSGKWATGWVHPPSFPQPRWLQGRSRDVTAAGSARRWRGRGWPSRRLIKLSPRGAQSRSRASPVSPHPHPAGHRPLGPGHLGHRGPPSPPTPVGWVSDSLSAEQKGQNTCFLRRWRGA